MNGLKNISPFTIRTLRLWLGGLMAAVMLSALIIPKSIPGNVFPILLPALLALWVVTFYMEGTYELSDLPMLFLLTATFAFGRAFSIMSPVTVAGIPIPITEMLLGLSFIFLLPKAKRTLLTWNRLLPLSLKIGLPLYVAVGMVYLLAGLKHNGALALRDIVFGQYILFLFLTLSLMTPPKDWDPDLAGRGQSKIRRLVVVFSASTVVLLFIGFVMNFITRHGKVSFLKYVHDTRVFNWALYLGTAAIFGLCFFTYKITSKFIIKNPKVFKWLMAAMIYFGLLFCLLTQVRAAWVGLVPALILMGIILKKEMKILAIIIPLIVVSVIVIDYVNKKTLAVMKEEITGFTPGKSETLSRKNVMFRYLIWQQTLEKMAVKPLLGWGYGMYPTYWIYHNKLPNGRGLGPNSKFTPAHNHILAVGYKMGLVGLALFIFINLRIFLLGVMYIEKCQSAFNRRFLIACIAGLLYWHGIAFFFDMLESPPTGIFLWVFLGSIISVVYADKRVNEKVNN
ncbi:MAG: O-antigen ligase family protein [bacterium]|nr:O-antigen ligase family protein [bacterium]